MNLLRRCEVDLNRSSLVGARMSGKSSAGAFLAFFGGFGVPPAYCRTELRFFEARTDIGLAGRTLSRGHAQQASGEVEAGSRKQEAGSRKQEAGSRKLRVESGERRTGVSRLTGVFDGRMEDEGGAAGEHVGAV
jgi:hypothetical protein